MPKPSLTIETAETDDPEQHFPSVGEKRARSVSECSEGEAGPRQRVELVAPPLSPLLQHPRRKAAHPSTIKLKISHTVLAALRRHLVYGGDVSEAKEVVQALTANTE